MNKDVYSVKLVKIMNWPENSGLIWIRETRILVASMIYDP